MKNTSKIVDMYFVILFVQMFFILSIIFFLDFDTTFLDFIMFSISIIIMVLAYFKGSIFGLLSSAIAIFIYVAMLLYNNISTGEGINTTAYVWIVYIPFAAFTSGRLSHHISQIQIEYEDLRKEYKDLVTIDKETGLNNTRGFYKDLDREISRARRHKNDLTLMLIKLPYYSELRKVIGEGKIGDIIYKISEEITKSSRGEDTRYTLEDGMLALLMPETNQEGAEIVKDRIKKAVKAIGESANVNIDILVACEEYNKEIKDSFQFKNIVEKELVYDV